MSHDEEEEEGFFEKSFPALQRMLNEKSKSKKSDRAAHSARPRAARVRIESSSSSSSPSVTQREARRGEGEELVMAAGWENEPKRCLSIFF